MSAAAALLLALLLQLRIIRTIQHESEYEQSVSKWQCSCTINSLFLRTMLIREKLDKEVDIVPSSECK